MSVQQITRNVAKGLAVTLIFVGFYITFTYVSFAQSYDASGACSFHGGINYSYGPGVQGKVVCMDGWTDSSVSFYSIAAFPNIDYCMDSASAFSMAAVKVFSYAPTAMRSEIINQTQLFVSQIENLKSQLQKDITDDEKMVSDMLAQYEATTLKSLNDSKQMIENIYTSAINSCNAYSLISEAEKTKCVNDKNAEKQKAITKLEDDRNNSIELYKAKMSISHNAYVQSLLYRQSKLTACGDALATLMNYFHNTPDPAATLSNPNPSIVNNSMPLPPPQSSSQVIKTSPSISRAPSAAAHGTIIEDINKKSPQVLATVTSGIQISTTSVPVEKNLPVAKTGIIQKFVNFILWLFRR
jgi:hypothetical protein